MQKFVLPKLPYEMNALEPVISKEIMEYHYGKHHQAYVNNLNLALEKYDEAEKKGDLAQLIELSDAIRFNGGGHWNHTFFWDSLAPPGNGGGGKPQGELLKAIEKDFGLFEIFVDKMSAKAAQVQGSGWGWLACDRDNKRLMITQTSNHGLVLGQGLKPLLCIDVWEHAYYLQYKNARAEFVKNIWKAFNWPKIEKRFTEENG